MCAIAHEVQVDRLAIRPGALELSAGTALNSLFNAAHLLPVDHGCTGLDGMYMYQLAPCSVHCQSSALFRALRFVVVLDPSHDLPELAGFFVLRHVRRLLEPDQLLAFGCLERL